MVCYKVRARTKTDLTDYKWFVVRSVIRYGHVPRSVIRHVHVPTLNVRTYLLSLNTL
jgi:hypothetical protein